MTDPAARADSNEHATDTSRSRETDGVDDTAGADGADEAGGTAGRAVPGPTGAARALFGTSLPLAQQYAALLVSTGIEHGHLGPREVERIWDRHLSNSAVVTDLVPTDATVLDVGSGAGLPGVAMAIRRPDLELVLIEPMLRRSAFLEHVVSELGLADRVRVLRGRAEDPAVRVAVAGASWVTARAVAPLERLAGWCLPLLAAGGHLLALKGSRAADEVRRFGTEAPQAVRAAVAEMTVVELGQDYGMDMTQVIRVERSARIEAHRRRSQ